MRLKLTIFLSAVVVALGLLLGTSVAQAEPIINIDVDTATGIQNLEVNGEFYNVEFLSISATDLYGSVYDFTDIDSARNAKDAVNSALNFDNRATKVGPSSAEGIIDYGIGYPETIGPNGLPSNVHNGSYSEQIGQMWWDSDFDFWILEDAHMYADFTIAGDPPDPVTIGGSATGLLGSGLVLQNNGRDDESIDADGVFTFDTPLTPGNSYNVTVAINPTDPAQSCIVEFGSGEVPPEGVTDVAVTCVDVPDPVTIGGNVTGLLGDGLVLQNNGKDDESIDADGVFTFDTPRTPGSLYDVTVATNPTSPAQTCSVDNSGGTVPLEDVTNVTVTCAEAVLGDLIKVAAEGQALPNGTFLKEILLDGGVAINIEGQVAFAGRKDDGIDAVFTQDKLVVQEGETLPDNNVLVNFSNQGELAINAGNSGDLVAFHGQDGNGEDGVWTQDGLVVLEGATVGHDGSTTLNEISDEGKVAINYFNQVAFHGKSRIEPDKGGGFERLRTVFISDGVETLAAALEGFPLPVDDAVVEEIKEVGGVAINLFGQVAFHGDMVDLGAPFKAVFTSDEMVAAVDGNTLGDGATILVDINEFGGVAINLFGQVAFHGDGVDPERGSETVKAVFTQDEMVVAEGDILPDGTLVEEINVNGGVAINVFGDVAFHGRTGGVKAVFTQNGLVAKVGDNLNDGTTLDEIWDIAGVAINPYDRQVAFHGKVGTTNAVFVGEAPVVVPAADGDE
jgi:hypothetical protein